MSTRRWGIRAAAGLVSAMGATFAGFAEDADRSRTAERLLDEVRAAWRPATIPDASCAWAVRRPTSRVRERLESIQLGAVDFHAAPLSRVAAALALLSVERDAAPGGGARGVNIVVVDPGGADPAVTIAVRDLSLRRVLELIAESAGFQVDIGEDAVALRPAAAAPALSTEIFALPRATLMRWLGDGETERDPDPAKLAEAKKSPGERDVTTAVRAFLQQAGIDFSHTPGSGLAYDGAALIITHSSANLERLRLLLSRYGEVRQVEIEAKFMEVQEGALEELGVQWSIARSVDPATGRPRELYRSPVRSLAQAFAGSRGSSSILIDGQEVARVGTPAIPGAVSLGDATEPFGVVSGMIGEFDVSAVVRALAQKNGSDLLSAPRVTVLSGVEATITVAQELRYPRQFGTIQSQVGTASAQNSGSAGVTITAGTPQDFTTQNVGVELRVRPRVEDDGSIALELSPTVTEFEGFVEYGGQSLAIASGRTVTIPSGFYQPIFSRRQVRTQVALRDGQTLVMGGLTREDVKKVKDKVPVLGSLPLLGRLFRSTSESTVKRNLLIFVTARLVTTGASPLANVTTPSDAESPP